MKPFEAMMWRSEPTVRSPVLVIEQLRTAPDWEQFLGVHEHAVAVVPRLRQRVVVPALGLGVPCWSVDRHFELDVHVRRSRLCEGAGWAELLAGAARWALEPFDRTRPPWEVVLCEGLPGGRAAYLIKLHHALADGLGAAQLLEHLHRAEPRPLDADQLPGTASAASGVRGGVLGVLGAACRHELAGAVDTVGAVGAGAWGAINDPVNAVSAATRYGLSLRRTLSPPDAPPSPLLTGRGPDWRFAALDVPLRELRAAAKAAGGTLNDTYLAALLGGYRRYHEALGAPVKAIPMGVPISLRRSADPAGGNQIAGARFSGPVGIVDPLSRIRAVRKLILSARAEPAIDTIGLLSPVLARLPGAMIAALTAPATAGNDLQAGFLPGPRSPRYLAGARVERVYPYAPLPGCPAMITMVTHGDVACVGINFDPASFTQPETFLRCLADGFSEVLCLQPDPAKPTRPGSPPTPAAVSGPRPPAPRAPSFTPAPALL